VITGAYSLTYQAIQLGLLPRLAILHTSAAHFGQIYIPRVNTALLGGVLLLVFLGANFFSTLSLVIAALVRSRERVQGMGQLITMPLFFASNALYPISLMPAWVAVIAHLNPLSYMVDGLRALMVAGGAGTLGLPLDFGVLLVANVLIVSLAARLYPNLVH